MKNPLVTDLRKTFINKLFLLAYEGLKKSQLVFSYNEINEVCPVIDSTPRGINGLAVQHHTQQGFEEATSFNFLHFTMQEYLAASYASIIFKLIKAHY